MKILAVSDEVVERLYNLCACGHFSDVELILGCGDLPYPYLENLLTFLNIPLLYVPGNHDPIYNPETPLAHVEGGSNLDLKLTRYKRFLIGGFGGSIRYRPEGVNQYTQKQMYTRMVRLLPDMIWNYYKGVRLDILVTHSPPLGIHDDDDLAHTGFAALRDFIRWFKPRYLLHGHTMFYKQNLVEPVTQVGATKIVNVYPYRVFELEVQ